MRWWRSSFPPRPRGARHATPITELDERFSDPAATATSWQDTVRAIEDAPLFWIATVRADGRPHVTPLVAVWWQGALHFGTGAGEQKAHNLDGNPKVVLTTGTSEWDRGLDIVVEGSAERVRDRTQLAELAAVWAGKWDGRWRFEADDDGLRHPGGHDTVRVYAVVPVKVLAFTKGAPFSQTRHRF